VALCREKRRKKMSKRLWTVTWFVGLNVVLAFTGWAQPVAEVNSTSDTAAPRHELVSDPTLVWNTFLGGSDWDDGYAIASDANGNTYVAGTSQGTWGSPIRPYGGAEDAFVAKLNRNGVLQWNTFLGSAVGADQAYAIALDGSGNVNVAGESLFSWGTPVNPHSADGSDIFVAQLSNNGVLKWNTFHGGQSIDRGYALAVDGSGNIYVSGESHGTWGSPVIPPSTSLINQEAFVAKLSKNGVRQWNTFMGEGNGADYARAVAVDGTVVVAGFSTNAWGTPVRAHSGDWYGDAFVAQLNSSSGVRQWNTFLGGARVDEVLAAAASAGDRYVTGYSYASWGTPIEPFPGNSENVFVARLNGSGALQWNTFLGGSDYEDDRGHAIAVARAGRVYVAGQSADTWGTPVTPHGGDWDAFVAHLSTGGALQWNTFLGRDDTDYGFAIASDDANVYIVGESHVQYGDWGTPVRPGSGSYDAFVVRLGVEPPQYNYALLPLIQRKR
jgi:hypothetical protein